MLRKTLHPLTDLTPRWIQTLALLSQGKAYGLSAPELQDSYQLRLKLGVGTLPAADTKSERQSNTEPRCLGEYAKLA